MISVDVLRSYVAYNPETGELRYVVSNKVAECITSKGYLRLKVRGQEILAHRAAWALTHDSWPTQFIDHINENKQDNRLCNLRLVTHSENLQNQGRPTKRSSTGLRGVSRSRTKFKVHICKDGVNKYIGTFDTLVEAGEAYERAKIALTKETANG